jgi:methylmalonyl-CoA mutase
LKHTGEYPIIGVNTYLSKEGSPTLVPGEVIRATQEEKQGQIDGLDALHTAHSENTASALDRVRDTAVQHGNLFEELMKAVKSCSLGQLTEAMFEVGGAYRRNM